MDQEKYRKAIAKAVSPLLVKASSILAAEIRMNSLSEDGIADLIHIQNLIIEADDQLNERS